MNLTCIKLLKEDTFCSHLSSLSEMAYLMVWQVGKWPEGREAWLAGRISPTLGLPKACPTPATSSGTTHGRKNQETKMVIPTPALTMVLHTFIVCFLHMGDPEPHLLWPRPMLEDLCWVGSTSLQNLFLPCSSGSVFLTVQECRKVTSMCAHAKTASPAKPSSGAHGSSIGWRWLPRLWVCEWSSLLEGETPELRGWGTVCDCEPLWNKN
jgi:hypothetical protein